MWERGYEAVSPRDLLAESGAGQGSLYHHFKGKMDLASVALGEVSDEMCELARETVGTDGSALDRVFRYLDVSRDGLKGCRMGRFAAESSIAEASLRKPVETVFPRTPGDPCRSFPRSPGRRRACETPRRQRAGPDAHHCRAGRLRRFEGLSRSERHQSSHGDGQVGAQIAAAPLTKQDEAVFAADTRGVELGLSSLRFWCVKFWVAGPHSPDGPGAQS